MADPDNPTPVASRPSKAGAQGIPVTNEGESNEAETKLTGAVRTNAIGKIEAKLRKDHPDWADDKVKSMATRAFERGVANASGASSNEGKESHKPETPPKLPQAAPPPDSENPTGITGTKVARTPSGLSTTKG